MNRSKKSNELHYMVITGRKFKIFEIAYSEDDIFYTGFVNGHYGPLREYQPDNHSLNDSYDSYDEDEDIDLNKHSPKHHKLNEPSIGKIKYFKVYLDEFKGTEAELIKMSNEQLRVILQDEIEIKKHFNDHSLLDYCNKKHLKDSYPGIVLHLDRTVIGKNYYQQTTGVVRVLSAPCNGTLDTHGLQEVDSKDFIIYRDEEAHPIHLSQKTNKHFEAKLCDQDGNILSDEVYKPGMTLPSFRDYNPSDSSIRPIMRNHPIWQTASEVSEELSTDFESNMELS